MAELPEKKTSSIFGGLTMKALKISLFLIAAGLVVFGMSSNALALHAGGVAHCDACHTMHNSHDNPVAGGTGDLSPGNAYLMKGSDPSSTCLICHNETTAPASGYHIATNDGSGKSQGGDFYWVKTAITFLERGNSVTLDPDNFGHNIVANDFGYAADQTNLVAPGGSLANTKLGCNSCHDPHGQSASPQGSADAIRGNSAPISASGSYGAADPVDGSILGAFRLLGSVGYDGGETGGLNFTAAAPIARSLNIGSGGFYGGATDYGYGMSEWCLNCHNGIVNINHHPAGNNEKLDGAEGTNYNRYVKTGDTATDRYATAYDSLVPIERGQTNRTLLNTASTLGADANSNVMCLTCHRAHASAFENAGRWDFTVEFIDHAPAVVATNALPTWAPYYKNSAVIDVEAVYGPWQRSLCNKCHVQD